MPAYTPLIFYIYYVCIVRTAYVQQRLKHQNCIYEMRYSQYCFVCSSTISHYPSQFHTFTHSHSYTDIILYMCMLCEDAIELTSLRVKMNKLKNKCRNNEEKAYTHTHTHPFNLCVGIFFLFYFLSVWFLSFKSQFNVVIKHERAQYLWL